MHDPVPNLFSYITIRKEYFGGYIFNPYRISEVPLNHYQIEVAELCNGKNTISDIVQDTASRWQITYQNSYEIVRETLKQFSQYYAINWKNLKLAYSEKSSSSDDEVSADDYNSYGINESYYSAPLSVIFELTHQCNLSCKHCLVSAGSAKNQELTYHEITDILVQLRNMKVFSVNFGGGEPLLRTDFLDILKFTGDLDLGIYFSTNGFLIKDSILEKLDDLKTYCVQISIDGLEDTHDHFRGIKGSYQRALWALKHFSDKGYHTTMSTMILKSNTGEIESLIKLCIELGISSFKLSTFMPAGRAQKNLDKYKLNKEELKQFTQQMLEYKSKYENQIYIDNKATYPWLIENRSVRPKQTKMNHQLRCSAGQTNLVISPTGDVLPCPFLQNMPAGNLRNEKLIDIWNNASVFNLFRNLGSNQLNGKCKTCKYIPGYCQGGCRAAALLHCDDFYAEDPFCWHSNVT